MNGKDIYEQYNLLSLNAKKDFLKSLNDDERILLNRYRVKLRQDKFKENKDNVEKYNEIRKEHIKKIRTNDKTKDFYKEKNKRDVKNFRIREKEQKAIIDAKLNLGNKLTDAIKAKKARQELIKLKNEKTNNNVVKSILNDVIDTIPKQADLKKKREYMRNYRAKKANVVK
jgi:hypothetical protein